MDTPAPSGSILDSLRTVEFRLTLKGYNVDEVDEYLEKAAVEAEALHEQVRQMTERVRQASERIAQLESDRREQPVAEQRPEPEAAVTDETLQRTLIMAQRFVDQTKADAQAEAADRMSQAEEKARATVAEAEERARTLTTESEQRLREEVTRLEAMRGKLATDVETMARHLEQERNRLRGALTEVLKWVDENVQPANSLMALHPRGEGQRPGPAGGPRPADAPRPGSEAGRPNEVGGAGGPESRPPVRPAPVAGGAPAGPKDADGGAQVLDLRGPTPGDRS